ncbi:MAG TPA: hypothetical protein PK156_48895, partial [Polyangium sp.]|nr:hypothetical protein [Polyangium sp.]
ELGRYPEAREIAAKIDMAPEASADTKAAALAAKALCDQRDKVFPDTDERSAPHDLPQKASEIA